MIQTERLKLRPWTQDDLSNMTRLNKDPEVMKHFPSTLTDEKSQQSLDIYIDHFNEHNFTYFAAERLDNQEFIGFIGIKWQTYEAPFTPCVDIGWRLLPSAWGNGFATEGAKACLDYAFNETDLKEIYSVCAKTNTASEKVMQRIGMKKIDEFSHPALGADSPLNPCMVYLIKKGED